MRALQRPLAGERTAFDSDEPPCISESESDCQNTRANITCQLQVDNWGLGSVFSQGAADAPASRRLASAPRLSTRMGLRDYLSPSPTVIVLGPQAG